MSGDKLSPLQWQILEVLAKMEPPWVLTGGGALVGFHLKHRFTKDLDFFWRDLTQLGPLPSEVRGLLSAAGLEVTAIQSGYTFARFRVTDGTAVCIVDLVAETVPALESPLQIVVGKASILVDTPHEILVNKLCALLSRSELRDLQDVKELLGSGADLDRALAEAPQKDTGFSPLTLAWVLKSLQVSALARAAGISGEESAAMEQFRSQFIQRLLESSAPSSER